MFRRALRIWLMHSLAFLAGLVVSGVVAVGLWFVVPTEGGNALFVGSALAVSIVSVGTGYGVYLALLAALLDLLPGWGFYLGGPLVVLAVMTLVFCAVYFRMLAAGAGSLLGYGLMYGIGGIVLHLNLRGDEPRAETGNGG
jgi:hypothetical protein